jgi:hypothetical protein
VKIGLVIIVRIGTSASSSALLLGVGAIALGLAAGDTLFLIAGAITVAAGGRLWLGIPAP